MHCLPLPISRQPKAGIINTSKRYYVSGGGKHLFSRRWRFRKATLQGAARCNNAGRMLARRTNRARCVSNALWQGARQSGSVVRNRAPRGRKRRTHKLRGGKHVRPGNEAAGHGPPPGGAAAASWASAGPPLRPAEAPPASNAAPDPWCPPPGRPNGAVSRHRMHRRSAARQLVRSPVALPGVAGDPALRSLLPTQVGLHPGRRGDTGPPGPASPLPQVAVGEGRAHPRLEVLGPAADVTAISPDLHRPNRALQSRRKSPHLGLLRRLDPPQTNSASSHPTRPGAGAAG